MDVNSLPKTVNRQHCGCDLNPGPSAPESSTLTTWLPSHPKYRYMTIMCTYQLHITAVQNTAFLIVLGQNFDSVFG